MLQENHWREARPRRNAKKEGEGFQKTNSNTMLKQKNKID